jgi:anti-sigma factor RsiW
VVSARCADIHAFADAELPDEEIAGFLQHLSACAGCQDELQAIYALKALVETMDDAPAPEK